MAATADPSVTDLSFSLSRDPEVKVPKPSQNPLNPFQGFNSMSGLSSNLSVSRATDSSFGVCFEHSSSDNNKEVPDTDTTCDKIKKKAQDTQMSTESEGSSGNESDNEDSSEEEEDVVMEESTGGIVFERDGKSESVRLE